MKKVKSLHFQLREETMKVSSKLFELHKLLEGYEHIAYKDSGGVLTIGVGHAAQDVEAFDETSVWSDEKIFEVWQKDIQVAEKKVNEYIKGLTISQEWFDALVDLVFNTGRKPQTMIGYLKKGDLDSARDEFLRWVYVKGVVHLGLVKRRFANYFMTLGRDPYQIIKIPLSKHYLGKFNDAIKEFGLKIEPINSRMKYTLAEV